VLEQFVEPKCFGVCLQFIGFLSCQFRRCLQHCWTNLLFTS